MENPIAKAARFAGKAKEIIRGQKRALLRARDTIRRQAEELEFLKALLARRLGFDKEKGMVVETGSVLVECPAPLALEDMAALAAGKPAAKA